MVATHIPGVTHSFFSSLLALSLSKGFRTFNSKLSTASKLYTLNSTLYPPSPWEGRGGVYSSNFNAASASSPFAFAARPSPVLSFTS